MIARGRAHFENCDPSVLQRAAELVASDREARRAQDLAPPGLAEYIDLVRVVTVQRSSPDTQCALLEEVASFALKKHPVERR